MLAQVTLIVVHIRHYFDWMDAVLIATIRLCLFHWIYSGYTLHITRNTRVADMQEPMHTAQQKNTTTSVIS